MQPVRIDVASRATGVPQSTIRRWIAEGKLPSTLIKGARYVRLDHVDHMKDAPIVRHLLKKVRD